MAMVTVIKARDTLAGYLFDIYDQKRRELRKSHSRNYSQNEFAKDIGMVPNTLNRYMNGDNGVTLDQAILLLKYFGPEILPHFDYGPALDPLTAEIIATIPTLDANQQKQIENIIRSVPDQEVVNSTNNKLVSA